VSQEAVVVDSQYRLSNHAFSLNVCGGYTLRADLLAGDTVLAKVVDWGDGTMASIHWLDGDESSLNEEPVLAWYKGNVGDHYSGLYEPYDMDSVVAFLRDKLVDTLE